MAALLPCTGHVVGARPVSIRIPSPSLRTAPSLGIGRQGRSASLVNHRLSAYGMDPHSRHRHSICSAHNDAASWPFGLDFDDYKPMTEEQINKFHVELNKDYKSNKHVDSTALSLHLCMVAKKGVKLASRVMDTAALRLDKQDGICVHTTKQTLEIYVPKFVKLAEDAYHKKFNDESLFSLIGAFRGVASVAHILLMDALKSIDHSQ
ncbi:hypothetical protein U9M48_034037 [Paspalum notatum var. saurae]|uniref:Uncharacterized protein n=1 Tax=Paspalum notatum var. saurae TaxID=547442 RepID=A0AAQ3UBS9_PASNO